MPDQVVHLQQLHGQTRKTSLLSFPPKTRLHGVRGVPSPTRCSRHLHRLVLRLIVGLVTSSLLKARRHLLPRKTSDPYYPTSCILLIDTIYSHSNFTPLDKIEAVFEQIADDMLHDKTSLSVLIKTRGKASRPGDTSTVVKEQRIAFPGKTAQEAWRFCRLQT